MSDSFDQTDLTVLLRRATNDSSYREPFLRAMLTNSVFFLATAKQVQQSSFSAGGQSFHIEDPRNALDFIELENNGERSIPFWTSLGELENDLHRFDMGEQPYMVMTGLDFLRHARGQSVVLNPGTFGRQFTQRQTEVLVRRGESDEQARQRAITQAAEQEAAQLALQQAEEQRLEEQRQAAAAEQARLEQQMLEQQRLLEEQARLAAQQQAETQAIQQHQPQQLPVQQSQPQQPQQLQQPERQAGAPDMSHGFHRQPGHQDSRESAPDVASGGLQPQRGRQDSRESSIEGTGFDQFDTQFQEFLRANPPEIAQTGQSGPPVSTGQTGQPARQPGAAQPETDQSGGLERNDQTAFHQLEAARDVVKLLLDGRSDEAWERLGRSTGAGSTAAGESSGSRDVLTRAIGLLLFTVLENGEADVAQREEKLNNAYEYWSEWTNWVLEQDFIDLPTHEQLKQMTHASCQCGHEAFEHGRYSWALREVGIQTEGPCEHAMCSCQAFQSDG